MKIRDLVNSIRDNVLALFGKPPLPADPIQEVRKLMSQVSDLCDRITAALTRIASDKQASTDKAAADASTISGLQSQLADAQTQLADAQQQLVDLLTPVVNQAETISPPPAA